MYLYVCIIVTLLPKNLLFSLNTFIKTHVMSIHADFRFPALFLAEFRVSWKIGFISVNSKTTILFKLCWAYFLYSAGSLYSHYSVESLLSLFLFSYYCLFISFSSQMRNWTIIDITKPRRSKNHPADWIGPAFKV